ncbi:MAG: hypothetical protein FJ387_28870, partial [Verrucomicrobia bacterium]|nr:hypothetical protein [Verrucomicrobiota bacterium]
MATAPRPHPETRTASSPADPPGATGSGRLRPQRSGRTPRGYRFCDGLTEGLVYWMAVFCPWAFGTTQPWAIWTMNVTGYVLGAALVSKWMIRWRTGYQPPRWGDGRTH